MNRRKPCPAVIGNGRELFHPCRGCRRGNGGGTAERLVNLDVHYVKIAPIGWRSWRLHTLEEKAELADDDAVLLTSTQRRGVDRDTGCVS